MARFEFHPAAQVEYEEALKWYFARSPSAAERFETDVEHGLHFIGSSGDLCPKYDESHRYCMLRHFPYSLVFSVAAESSIQIVAVMHASRRPGYWHGEREID